MPHTFMGLFHANDFRSHSLLRDLEANFGDTQFFIVWDHYDANAPDDFGRYFAAFAGGTRDPGILTDRMRSDAFAATSRDDKTMVLAVRT